MRTMFGLPCAFTLGLTAAASAQVVDVSFSRPSMDRWMYPFNFSRGSETVAPAFGAILQTGFDDRDADLLLGFVTGGESPLVTPGLGVGAYRILSARLTVVVSNDMEVAYDPSWDSVTSLYAEGDPQRTVDADPGRPTEVFAAGYRNGWTLQSFQESSTFGGTPLVEPAEGARNVFPALISDSGVVTDVSRQVRERIEAMPLAIGRTDAVAPGALIPAGTVLAFDMTPCDPAVAQYLASSLNAGKINLVVSSLQPAQGGPGGGTGERTYPVFYTKENPLDLAATLTLRVRVGEAADFNGDGFVDFFDYDDFVAAFEAGDASADFNQDCFADFFDYDAFVQAFEG